MKIEVSVGLVGRIEKIVERLNAKLTQYGLATLYFAYHIFNRIPEDSLVGEQIAEVTIGFPTIEINGWELVAVLKPGITESYCYPISHREIPEQYRNLDAMSAVHCEHCGTNRRRNNTVLLYHKGENRWARVGSSCSEDFLQTSSDKIMWAINTLDRVRKEVENPRDVEPVQAFLSRNIIAMTAQYLASGGKYLSQKAAREVGQDPTWRVVREMLRSNTQIDPKFFIFADKAIEWLPRHIDKVDMDRKRDYHRNLEAAILYDGEGSGAVTTQSGAFQTVVSLPMFLKRNNGNGAKYNGEEIKLDVTIRRLCAPFPSAFEKDAMVQRVVAWNKSIGDVTWHSTEGYFQAGEHVTIKGFIREKGSYQGRPQTSLRGVQVV